ncbi:hypothetical protein BDV97DRAFT_392555 [Delphinella strobiligena]|nr:hypothetical protein BDV97DRAFT_392555 [Delphinella strobiligena]
MTAFDDKPLPQVGEATPKLPPLSPVEADNTPPRRRQSDRSDKQGTKMSLFGLFSRPKVEKFRGYAEAGLPLPPVQELISRAATPDLRKTEKQSFDKPYPPLPKGSPRRSSHSTSREGAARQRRGSCISPSLSQAYAQAIKASSAHTTDGAIPLQVSRNRRDSQDVSVRPERSHRNASLTSVQYSALPKKVFTLLLSGHVLQYSDQGHAERQPERVLSLTLDSVVYVCNSIPGEPFVLQVAQNNEALNAGLSSPVSFISRMGFRGALARKEAANMILVLKNAKELNDWMVLIRKCVQLLGGDAAEEGNKGEGVVIEDEQRVEDLDSREGTVGQALASNHDFAHLPATSDLEAGNTTISPEPKATTDLDEKVSVPEPASLHRRSTSSLRLASPSHKQNVLVMETKSEDSNSATPRDSPMSGTDCDAASSDEQARKHFPFKIRSAIPAHLPQPKSTFFSASTSLFSSPITSPRSTLDFCDQIQFVDKDDSRPESIVAELPTIRKPRILGRVNTPTPTTTTGTEAKHRDPRLRPLRTSESTTLRRSITKPFALPLKIDTTMSAYEVGSKPKQANGDDSPVVKTMNTTPPPISTRSPRRTPSVKLSLFPPPTPAPAVASNPARVATKNAHSLRRPASLQVNSNPAPFLSSIRSSSAATATTTRQPLRKAESATSLRTAGAMANTGGKVTPIRSPTSDYRFVNPNKDLAGNTFMRSRFGNSISNTPRPPTLRSASALELRRPQSRNKIMTASPPSRSIPAPASKVVLHRPKTSSRDVTRSPEMMSPGLPKLDLGLPVIGLAPPAPPPTRDLPSLPPPPQVPPKGSVGVECQGKNMARLVSNYDDSGSFWVILVLLQS